MPHDGDACRDWVDRAARPETGREKTTVESRQTALSHEVIEILKKGFASARSRASLKRAPKEFLARRGVGLPEGVDISIYEWPGGPKGDPEAPGHFIDLGVAEREIQQVDPGLDTWWRESHQGCPYRTYPYTAQTISEGCVAWAVTFTGKEWVQDVPGTAQGHWEYQNATPMCIRTAPIVTTETVCLPIHPMG